MIFGSVWPLGWEGLFLYAFASLRGRWRGDMCRRAVCNVVGRLGDGVRKHVRADAAQRWLLLSVSELWAGAALSLAGFGSGRSVGARGGDNGDCPAWRWSSIVAFCARLMSAVQFYRNVLRSITHIVAVLLGRFGLDYACCLTERQTGRLAICFVSIPRGSGAPFVRSRGGIGLSCFVGSLWDWTFLYGDPDGVRPESVYTKRSAVSSGASFVMACLFVMMPRGVRWGLRAPKPAPKSQCGSRTAASLDSPHLIRGVGAFCAVRIVRMRSVSARKPPRAFLYRRCRRSPSARSAGGPPEGRSALPCRKGCCRSTGGWARAGRRGTCQFPPSRP